ncbi:dephospho-CoA kinase [Candidatus Pelagibacter bacterium]|nr:dephospho-CoA kinase [Candidatus Pelagibacter bacterium]MDA9619149.1 dephospho-CoA kinase [Candidatus Pelagibacter bacterium]
MIKIGITGTLASGKTTASKILSFKRGPLFSADKVVKELYKNKKFKFLISKRFKITNNNQIKRYLKKIILKNKDNIKKLEKIIHPLVRKKMKRFTSQNRNKKFLFYEIPLLIESKLMKYFNVIVFIKAKKKLRFKRFQSKSGDKMLFNLLNNKQMNDTKKIKFCDHVVVNEKNLNILKKNLLVIIEKYE